MREVRIFLSSPGDTHFERLRISRILERLNGELANTTRLVAIRWEDAAYNAHSTFQKQIPEAAECVGADGVAVIVVAAVEAPGHLEDAPGRELRAVPRSLPGAVVLRDEHAQVIRHADVRRAGLGSAGQKHACVDA